MKSKATVQIPTPFRILLAAVGLGLVAAALEVTTTPQITNPDQATLLSLHSKK
jgi:hypothetical protein